MTDPIRFTVLAGNGVSILVGVLRFIIALPSSGVSSSSMKKSDVVTTSPCPLMTETMRSDTDDFRLMDCMLLLRKDVDMCLDEEFRAVLEYLLEPDAFASVGRAGRFVEDVEERSDLDDSSISKNRLSW